MPVGKRIDEMSLIRMEKEGILIKNNIDVQFR